MSRYKQLLSPPLSQRKYNGQVGEILAGVKVMNKVIGLGMPVRQTPAPQLKRLSLAGVAISTLI